MADAPAATDGESAPPSTEAVAQTTARLLGWTPKEEFAGNPSNWVPAAAYVDRVGKRFPGLFDTVDRVARAQAETQGTIATMGRELSETRATMTELRDYARRARDAGYQRGLAEAHQRLTAARTAGDVDAAAAAGAEVATLEAERARAAPEADPPPAPRVEPPPAPRQAPRNTPEEQVVVDTWVGENKWWYLANVRLKNTAEGILAELNSTRPDLNLKQKLDKVLEETRAAFPRDFGIRADDVRPAALLQPGSTQDPPRAPGGRTFDDLPPESKAAFFKFEKELSLPGKPYTKQEYLAAYVWD
jgi:hypothetical protein